MEHDIISMNQIQFKKDRLYNAFNAKATDKLQQLKHDFEEEY